MPSFHKAAWWLPAVFLWAAATLLPAQPTGDAARTTSRAIQALNSLETFTPNDRFAEPSPADSDLGEQQILTTNERYRPFNVSAGYSALWTSNAFYTPDSPAGDVIMNAFAEAAALPHLGGNFFFESAARVGGYRYFLNPSLDFNSLDVTLGLLKAFRELWDIGVYGRYQYSLLWGRGGPEILHEHSLVAGLRKTFQVTRAHSIYVSAEADFSLGGWPSYAMAHEFSLYAAHQVDWTRGLSTSLYYQMAIYDFREGGRADLRNFVGLAAGVKPFRWLTLSASAWLGWNGSNESEYDFFVANLGGAITGSVNF